MPIKIENHITHLFLYFLLSGLARWPLSPLTKGTQARVCIRVRYKRRTVGGGRLGGFDQEVVTYIRQKCAAQLSELSKND